MYVCMCICMYVCMWAYMKMYICITIKEFHYCNFIISGIIFRIMLGLDFCKFLEFLGFQK